MDGDQEMKYTTVDIYIMLERITEDISEINENVRILMNKKLGSRSRKPTDEDRDEDSGETIDRGKVLALRKAGWSYSKIAEEMQCSKSAIANIIKEESA